MLAAAPWSSDQFSRCCIATPDAGGGQAAALLVDAAMSGKLERDSLRAQLVSAPRRFVWSTIGHYEAHGPSFSFIYKVGHSAGCAECHLESLSALNATVLNRGGWLIGNDPYPKVQATASSLANVAGWPLLSHVAMAVGTKADCLVNWQLARSQQAERRFLIGLSFGRSNDTHQAPIRSLLLRIADILRSRGGVLSPIVVGPNEY